MIQFCGSRSAFLRDRWKHQDSPVQPGSVRSPLASSFMIALSVLPEAGARGGSPLSEASILLRLPSLGGGRLSSPAFPQPRIKRLLRSHGETLRRVPPAAGGARAVIDAARVCPKRIHKLCSSLQCKLFQCLLPSLFHKLFQCLRQCLSQSSGAGSRASGRFGGTLSGLLSGASKPSRGITCP